MPILPLIHKKNEANRRRESMSEENKNEFVSTIEKYLKHRGLEIVFTLKNGKKVTMNGRRKLVGSDIIQYFGEEEGIILPLTDIQTADVYAL